jgi:ADP-ribose pyrophosphatase YjhB (NUDIX family)
MAGSGHPNLPQLQVQDLHQTTGYAMTARGLMRDEGRIMLTLSARDRRWRLPGGNVRRMETPADAVRREVRAVTGICVQVVDYLGIVHDPRESAIHLMFEVRAVEGCALYLDAERVLHAAWFRGAELPVNVCECTRSCIEAFSGQRSLPFLVSHLGGNCGLWQE